MQLSSGKFLDISKRGADGNLEEQLLVSYYISRGTYSDDSVNFPELVAESSDALSKLLPDFKILSQGQTTVNVWKAYETQFQGGGTDPAEVFRLFRGRAPSITPLLRHAGLTQTS